MSALKDIRQYLQANEATLDTIQQAVDEVALEMVKRDDQNNSALHEIQRSLVTIMSNQDLVANQLTLLQDQVIEGFRRLGARVSRVEEKEKDPS